LNKPLFLIVEDDKAVRNLIATTLEIRGYQYKLAKNGREAIAEMISSQPDLMILDLGLPDMNGTEVIKKVRTWSAIPIIIVSARSDAQDKISALDAGADDYLTKPFSVDELLARIRVALRHLERQDESIHASSQFINGNLKIDYASGCVFVGGNEIHLTPIEYRLLCLLAKNAGKVLTHNYIIQKIWSNALPMEIASLRVFMTTLRKKIEPSPASPKYIQTHIGIGYRMLQQIPEDGSEEVSEDMPEKAEG
jgi:two-component system KDP operon response regulator KdpE